MGFIFGRRLTKLSKGRNKDVAERRGLLITIRGVPATCPPYPGSVVERTLLPTWAFRQWHLPSHLATQRQTNADGGVVAASIDSSHGQRFLFRSCSGRPTAGSFECAHNARGAASCPGLPGVSGDDSGEYSGFMAVESGAAVSRITPSIDAQWSYRSRTSLIRLKIQTLVTDRTKRFNCVS